MHFWDIDRSFVPQNLESLKTDINLEKKKKNWEMQSENCKTKSTVR